MQGAEVPVRVVDALHKLLQVGVERGDVDALICVKSDEVLCNGRRFVRQHVIHLIVSVLEVLRTVEELLAARHFLLPPALAWGAHISVLTFAAAHTEERLFFKRKDFAAAEVIDVVGNLVRVAALEAVRSVRAEHIKILVHTVYKADGVFFLFQLIQRLFLLVAAVPEEAEIAADNKRVVLRQLAKRRIFKKIDVAVYVARDVYHFFIPKLY